MSLRRRASSGSDSTRRNLKINLTRTPYSAETWYQAPGQGSMLVTAPGAAEPAGSSIGPSAEPSPVRNLALLLLGAGGFCAIDLRNSSGVIVQNASRTALTTVRATSRLRRSSAMSLSSKYAFGSIAIS